MADYIELSWLQEIIKGKVGSIKQWIHAEISSHSIRNGHHYLDLIEKAPDGTLAAKAGAIIWRRDSSIVNDFASATGKTLESGMSIVALVQVNYSHLYGISLIIEDIDLNYSIGEREKEKQRTIKDLGDNGLIDRQQSLEMPFLPGRIAVISSSEAAGYGDFTKHLANNGYGFSFNCTLYPALMQGEKCPISICEALQQIEEDGGYDLVLILRGGGSNVDLFAFDDYSMCEAIATCPIPVLTAIGHERDYHVADMVAREHFKTPTALADALIDWVAAVEDSMLDHAEAIRNSLKERISAVELQLVSSLGNISFALRSSVDSLEHEVELLHTKINTADPRGILRLGYVLASDNKGRILKIASDGRVGDDFTLRFSDGMWKCTINEIKKHDK